VDNKKKGPPALASGPSLGRKRPRRAAVTPKRYRTANKWTFWPKIASDADLFFHANMQCCASHATDQFRVKPMNGLKFMFENKRMQSGRQSTATSPKERANVGGERSQ
jgi:hypothetical protein